MGSGNSDSGMAWVGREGGGVMGLTGVIEYRYGPWVFENEVAIYIGRMLTVF